MKNVLPLFPLVLSVALSMAALPQASGALLIEDFQSQTPGGAYTGATVTAPANKVRITGGSGGIADPFGVPGNLSLMVEKTDPVGTATPRVAWSIPTITEGTFDFDLYTYYNTSDGFTKPLFNFFSYQDTTAKIGVRFWFDTAGVVYLGDGATTRTVAGVWTHNTVNHVSVEIFENGTYTLSVNGNLIGWESGGVTKTVFDYNYAGAGGVSTNTFQFAIADSARVGARFFVDNITVIPEPGTVGLLGAAAIAGLIMHRKRSKVSRS